MKAYEQKDVCNAADIEPATLRNWIVRGLIEPAFPAEGKGSRTRYDTSDLMTCVALARLVDLGLAPGTAADLARAVGEDASAYLLRHRPGVVSAGFDDQAGRLYWRNTEHGWQWSTEPDWTTPTIALDSHALARQAVERLTGFDFDNTENG